MTRIDLSFLQNMLCLVPDTPEERMRLGKDALPVRTRDGDMLFDRGRIELVRSYGNERVYNAAVRLMGLVRQDIPRMEHRGVTGHWLADFLYNKDAFYERLSEDYADKEATAAARLFSLATELPGSQVARKVLFLAQGHWLGELLGVNVSSLQTMEGLHAGLRQMNGRLRNPLVEERVLATGISTEELSQMRDAQAALHRMIDEGREVEAAATAGLSPLLVARAILWTEMTLIGAVARAELPEERFRLYQGQSLLEMPPRGPERRDRPTPEPTPTPAPITGHGPQPATGPTAGPPLTGTVTPVATAPSDSLPPAAAAPDGIAVPPGTALYATPPGAKRPVPVVLRSDGTLTWGERPAAAPRKSRPRKSRR